MIWWILSRFYFVIGMVMMFVPAFMGRPDTSDTFIPLGLLVSICGILTMGPKKEKKRKENENILDDGEF